MNFTQTISVPSLVRVKPGALARVGVYLARADHRRVAVMVSAGLNPEFSETFEQGTAEQGIAVLRRAGIGDATFEQATQQFSEPPSDVQAIVGIGGGKALDAAKYLAFLADLPYYAVPTSLSNDGFCSPQSSLTVAGKRRSLPARLPAGVVIDTDVCLRAPDPLWWSGIGDLIAKVTAVHDWKLAFHARGERVNDLAALLSDATVLQFMARPAHDAEGMRLLGTSLMLNGIAMEIAGTSRPASGSEHLISHALDRISARPRLHGLQVGVATYIVAGLQGQGTERIAQVLDRTRFWNGIRSDPFSRREWLQAASLAPSIKPDRYTVLSERNCLPDIERMIVGDPQLVPCFTE